MKLNIALIGYKFMGKAHSYALKTAPFFFQHGVEPVLKVICGRTEHLVRQAAQEFGWEEACTDWREAVQRPDIDVVDIATPLVNHKEIAIAAAKAGKHIFCEKPLGMNSDECREMLAAAEEAGVVHMLGHNYRRCPSAGLARELIQEGKLGKIYHVRAVYLQDWIMDPQFPAMWKLQKEFAGSGPHGDLNTHIIDLTRFMTGLEFDEVSGVMETFIKKRPKTTTAETLNTMLTADAPGAKEMADVTVEDCCAFLCRFKGGAIGTFEATRFAGGRKNHNRIEINGEKGTLVYSLENMNVLEYWSALDDPKTQGFSNIMVTEAEHPYISHWWPAGHIIGYENTFVNQFADFFNCIKTGSKASPNFEDGLRCIEVTDAVEKSAQTRQWVRV